MNQSKYDGDPYHPIVDSPWRYDVVELHYVRDPAEPSNARLDLTLQKDAVKRRLRFLGVQSLSIEEGFPGCTSGLCILDASRRQLDGLRVRVDDFEASGGRLRFWARDVIDRDNCDDD